MRNFLLLMLLLGSCVSLSAQNLQPKPVSQLVLASDDDSDKVYRVNPWISGGIALAGTFTNSIGFNRLQRKPILTLAELESLDPNDIPRFDRSGLRQDLDKVDQAANISNIFLAGGSLLPVTLFLDRRIRKDWLDITILYIETQAIASNFYSWSPIGPTFIDRLRPRAYYSDLPLEEKESPGTRNSFFSGHVSSVAVGSFFFAKVYTDYHPELGGKKWLIYGLAAIPPSVTAYLRVRSLKHWPSDTIVGGIVGASVGYLVPQIHKNWQKKHRSKLDLNASYSTAFKGMGVQLTF